MIISYIYIDMCVICVPYLMTVCDMCVILNDRIPINLAL